MAQVAGAISKVHPIEGLPSTAFRFFAIKPGHVQGEGHVLCSSEVGQQTRGLEDPADRLANERAPARIVQEVETLAKNPALALVVGNRATQDPHQARLARPEA